MPPKRSEDWKNSADREAFGVEYVLRRPLLKAEMNSMVVIATLLNKNAIFLASLIMIPANVPRHEIKNT